MATATTTPMMTTVSIPPEPEGRVGGREAVSTPPEPRERGGGGGRETGHFNKTSYRLLHVLFEVQDILIRGVAAKVTIVLSS